MFQLLPDIRKETGDLDLYVNCMFIHSAFLFDLERGYIITKSNGRRKAGRPTRCTLQRYDFTTWTHGESVGTLTALTNEEAITKAEAMMAKAVQGV